MKKQIYPIRNRRKTSLNVPDSEPKIALLKKYPKLISSLVGIVLFLIGVVQDDVYQWFKKDTLRDEITFVESIPLEVNAVSFLEKHKISFKEVELGVNRHILACGQHYILDLATSRTGKIVGYTVMQTSELFTPEIPYTGKLLGKATFAEINDDTKIGYDASYSRIFEYREIMSSWRGTNYENIFLGYSGEYSDFEKIEHESGGYERNQVSTDQVDLNRFRTNIYPDTFSYGTPISTDWDTLRIAGEICPSYEPTLSEKIARVWYELKDRFRSDTQEVSKL